MPYLHAGLGPLNFVAKTRMFQTLCVGWIVCESKRRYEALAEKIHSQTAAQSLIQDEIKKREGKRWRHGLLVVEDATAKILCGLRSQRDRYEKMQDVGTDMNC